MKRAALGVSCMLVLGGCLSSEDRPPAVSPGPDAVSSVEPQMEVPSYLPTATADPGVAGQGAIDLPPVPPGEPFFDQPQGPFEEGDWSDWPVWDDGIGGIERDPESYFSRVHEEQGWFNAGVPFDRGALQGQLAAARVEGQSVLQGAWIDAWNDEWDHGSSMNMEVHGESDSGAAMLIVSMMDLRPIADALRADAAPGDTIAVMSDVEVIGCAGPQMHNYPYDEPAEEGEVSLVAHPDDADTVVVEVEADFGTDGTLRGSIELSRSELLPLLDRALAI